MVVMAGRALDIVSGKTKLPERVVNRYVVALAARGIVMPDGISVDDATTWLNENKSEKPDISTIGTKIREAIETAGDFKLSCGACLAYLRSLNQQTEHDADKITKRLLLELQIPLEAAGINRRTSRNAVVAG